MHSVSQSEFVLFFTIRDSMPCTATWKPSSTPHQALIEEFLEEGIRHKDKNEFPYRMIYIRVVLECETDEVVLIEQEGWKIPAEVKALKKADLGEWEWGASDDVENRHLFGHVYFYNSEY
jgi:hypothetical protein